MGLSKDQANEELCRINEDVRKSVKVTFSEADYAPPISDLLQSWRYEIRTIKCYTAEEIGEQVGLSVNPIQEELTTISTDLKKQLKVTFSEQDYAPPIYTSILVRRISSDRMARA